MCDVKCPYCGTEQEINHDDGYGYEEGKEHEQCCVECEKDFVFFTEISFDYNVYCQDGDHIMEPFGSKFPGMCGCEKCSFYEKRDS